MHAADPENNDDLVQRAREGDSDAFAELYSAYFTPLYRYLYFRVQDKADADDLTQEVFLKAYASFKNFLPMVNTTDTVPSANTAKSPLPYFYTIARNRLIDHYRKKKSVTLEDEVMQAIPDTTDSLEEAAAKNQEYEHIRKRITELPPDQQDALVLRFINGLSTEEVAKVLGKKEDAVRQLQSRGLRALKKKLDDSN